MGAHVTSEWNGDELIRRADRAAGRACISISEQIAILAKQIVHVQSGTLRRSIHVAIPDEMHFDDEDAARSGDDLNEGLPLEWPEIVKDHVALTEVGSWIAYACVEETGRQHFYMSPAYEQVVPTMTLTIEEAFRQEGL